MSELISIAEHADCIEFMKEFPDKFFDLAIVDPPYGRRKKKHAQSTR
jgi:DNA modification methylase